MSGDLTFENYYVDDRYQRHPPYPLIWVWELTNYEDYPEMNAVFVVESGFKTLRWEGRLDHHDHKITEIHADAHPDFDFSSVEMILLSLHKYHGPWLSQRLGIGIPCLDPIDTIELPPDIL